MVLEVTILCLTLLAVVFMNRNKKGGIHIHINTNTTTTNKHEVIPPEYTTPVGVTQTDDDIEKQTGFMDAFGKLLNGDFKGFLENDDGGN